MFVEDFSLKTESLLRRAGISDVPRPALIGILLVGLLVVLVCLWQFWPHPSSDFIANANSAENKTVQDAANEPDKAASEIIVDIEGAVSAPGLYALPSDSRVGDAVVAAGGLTSEAVSGAVNLAQKVADGDQILIPSESDVSQQTETQANGERQSASSAGQGSNKININTASAEELQVLSGVGPSLSEKIVQYRESNGRFTTIEDLQNVSGIGKTRFANIKDMICV